MSQKDIFRPKSIFWLFCNGSRGLPLGSRGYVAKIPQFRHGYGKYKISTIFPQIVRKTHVFTEISGQNNLSKFLSYVYPIILV